MKVFIFGAGASKGSQDFKTPALTAPLIDELFSKNYEQFAREVGFSKSDLDFCREKVTEIQSLEKWLSSRWTDLNNGGEAKKFFAERAFFGRLTFYIWKVLLAVSEQYNEYGAYRKLLNKLKSDSEEFGLINFNYDLLLDYAAKDVYGITLTSLENYLDFDYIKPHGSVNWFLDRRKSDPELGPETNMDTRVRFDQASRMMFGDENLSFTGTTIIDPNHRDLYNVDSIIHRFRGQYFYPLVLLPLAVKSYDYIEGFSNAVIDKGKDLLSKADEIFLIGYRAQDEVIGTLLENVRTNTSLVVISPNNPEEISKRVLSLKSNLNSKGTIKSGFMEFVDGYKS